MSSILSIQHIDHIAISVPKGQLDAQVRLYEQLGFSVVH